ncbi:MAG: TraB/GumN family protein [Rhodobacteraceae bacterium]|nr:TraB/GumN family protein [Paracoccaceae bacterium]MCC0047414.1 TraB/GumN family protein [Defluviimonas sp.]HPE26873.1 TraB/GumN family protein [Albidovulum sp.]HRV63735.1 TraB/GumN family protein [Albidovulum sp.]
MKPEPIVNQGTANQMFAPFRMAVVLAAFLMPASLSAQCAGQNLLDAMPSDAFAALEAGSETHPYATGNRFVATKGESTIHFVGTLHVYDARMKEPLERLRAVIALSDAVYVEATEAEQAQLKSEIAKRPDLIFATEGATLPERLGQADWTLLSGELAARGMPAVLASKLRPWYATAVLGVPPCAIKELGGQANGLDKLIMDAAAEARVPVHALEPYDAAIRVFTDMDDADQLDILRSSLPLLGEAENVYETLIESYFAEKNRLFWEYTRERSVAESPDDPETAAADFARMENALLIRRNYSWIDPILKAAEGREIIVAVGAAHLSGINGILALVEEQGYRIDRESF